MTATGVVVDYDAAVWLPGPNGDDVDGWIAGAFDACAADFGLSHDAPQAAYLRELLTCSPPVSCIATSGSSGCAAPPSRP